MALVYFSPAWALGKTSDRVLNSAALPAAGSKTLTFDNTDLAFAVGDLVFVSETGGVEHEFLGRVISKASNNLSLRVEIPLQAAKAVNARVWKPTTYFRFRNPPGFEEEYRFLPGIRSRISRGGIVYSTKVADTVQWVAYVWKHGLTSDFGGSRDWLIAQRDSGLKDFTLGWYDQSSMLARCSRVRLLLTPSFALDDLPGISAEVQGPGGADGDVAALYAYRLAILNADAYVSE